MAPRNVIAVEREDLALGVALLDLHRENEFLELPLERLLVGQEQVPRQLLGQRAGAVALAVDDVLDRRDEQARNAEAEVVFEGLIFGGDDGLSEQRRDLLVGHDDAALGGELADDLALEVEDARDRVRRVVVERGNLRQVVGGSEEQAAERAEPGREHEEQGDGGAAGEADDVVGH